MSKVFAIGDVHGCLSMLKGLVGKIPITEEDTIVFLGDYIDRGPESSSEMVGHRLMDWYKHVVRCRLKPSGAIVICEAEQDTTFSSWILDEFKDENWEVIETPSEPYKWTTQYQQRPVREDEI